MNGEGAIYTKNRLPVELFYFEEFDRIDDAFKREKQIQNWSQAKKKALAKSMFDKLNGLAECKNLSHYKNMTDVSTPLDDRNVTK